MSRVFDDFPRDACEHVAGLDRGAVVDREDRVDRQEIPGFETVGQHQHIARGVEQL